MNDNKICPACNKRHNKFPRKCYYFAHAEYAHCVIAKLASLGNAQQQEFDKQAKDNWEKMSAYARLNFPDDIKEET